MADLRAHGPSVNADVIDVAEQKRRNALHVLDILLRFYVPKGSSDARELAEAIAALTGAQPAPAAPSERGMHLNYVWNTLQFFASESSYTMGERTGGVLQGCPRKPPPTPAEMAGYARFGLAELFRYVGREPDAWLLDGSAAPAAQPADSAMEVLRELVAVDDLKRSRAQAELHASKFPSDENCAVVDKLWSEIARRLQPAWDRARALVAKETPHAR